MFTVLNITKRKNNVLEKAFGCFIRDEYNVKTIGIYKGAPFYLLNVRVGKRGIDCQKILDCVGKCSKRMVTNDFDLLPETGDFGLFKSNKLYDKMMQNTFVEILRANTVTENLFSMCLIDEKATNTDFAERVCDYCSTLTIVTAKRDKYNSVCEKITENTGLCPVIKSKTDDEKIIIDLDDSNMQIRIDNNMIINGGEEFIVPEIYNYIKPETINKYDFYSALYELCGVFSLADGVFETIRVNNEKKSIADIHFS